MNQFRKSAIIILIFAYEICLSQTGWIQQLSGTNDSLRSVKFIDSQTGWTAGTNGIILKTSNSGSNWISLNTGISNDLYSIYVISASVVYAAGDSGLIIKTTDSGFNWTTINSGINTRLNSIFFVNSTTGFAAGFNGKIIRTINSGNNWTILNSGTDIQLNSVYFTSTLKGWVAGYGGIFHTSDGGSIWYPQFIDGSLILNSIFFTDSLHGWAAYYDNNTFGPENVRTTTGGLSWINYSMNNSYSISVFFRNYLTGWSSGYYGRINFSTDGGTSWTTQSSGTIEHLNSIYFTDSTTGWIVGNSGIILKTTTGGILTNFTASEIQIPDDFTLEQNYPNPFNPSTVIRYTLTSDEFISLKVYDNLGNVVAVLTNTFRRKGNYDVVFNAENFPSGIYYCRMESGSFSKTNKMALLR